MSVLFSHACLALNSVAGIEVDFTLANSGVTPTIIAASSQTISNAHAEIMKSNFGYAEKRERWFHERTLKAGRMPKANLFIQNYSPVRHAIGNTAKLRILYVSERAGGAQSPPLTSAMLSDLRVFTGARVVYALTAKGVAGAVAQTNLFDYRKEESQAVEDTKCSHFGAPLSSVEMKLVDTAGYRTAEEGSPKGQVRCSHTPGLSALESSILINRAMD